MQAAWHRHQHAVSDIAEVRRQAAVTLGHDVANTSSQTVILHDFIPVPGGMMTLELDDGRRVFAPLPSNQDEVKRRALSHEER